MKINYQPNSKLESFAAEALHLVAEKFPQTFFVGGFVRDLLLNRPVYDIDIATEATPVQVHHLVEGIFSVDDVGKNFGVLRLGLEESWIEVATFRTESYADSRYPKVEFTDSLEADSRRRDFTINSLYMGKEGEIYDFHGGIGDIAKGIIRFIGDPQTRLQEDPLRLLRALRFALQLEFVLEKNTAQAIQNNFALLQQLKPQQTESEIQKLSSELQKRFKIIINRQVLDADLINSL